MKEEDSFKNEEHRDEDIMDDGMEYDDGLEIDDLEKERIDLRRLKIIDQSKKKAAVDSVFDERTYFQINQILKKGILNDIEGIISAGKEANIYLAHTGDKEDVAVKIYKVDNNTSKWMRDYIIGDPRYKKVPKNISKIIFLWANKEYKNLKRAYNVGLMVPKPIYVKNNVLIMEYIGTRSTPAPKLKDIRKFTNPLEIFDQICYFIKNLYQKAKLVHGDLSEFNILYQNKKAVIIDISQAVTTDHPKSEVYLVRDIKNIFNYFEKLRVETPNPKDFYYEIINFKRKSNDI